MMRSAVTLSLVPEARGGPFVFWDDLDAAANTAGALGFDAIEIFPRSVRELDPSRLKKILSRNKLTLAAMGSGAGWVVEKLRLTDISPAVREKAVQFIREVIDFAAEFGAPAIVGSMQGRIEPGVDRAQALTWLKEALRELSAAARARKTVLLFEPLNRYETNVLNTVAETIALLEPIDNVKILCDLFHMNIEEVHVAQSLESAGARLGHFHLADSNRRAAGLGHIDYAPIAAALKRMKYRGYVSAEVLPLPGSRQAAEQSIATFRKFFS